MNSPHVSAPYDPFLFFFVFWCTYRGMWCQEVDVKNFSNATLPNEPVSGEEELDVLSNPLLASPLGKEVQKKEVQSSD